MSRPRSKCIIWPGKISKALGYGYLTVGYGRTAETKRSGMVYAHRYAWEQARGPIPAGLVIDHVCMNKACVNVAHLRLVTRAVNATENSDSAAALNKAKTHCAKGHPYSGSNVRFKKPSGWRVCRTCHREEEKERKRRLLAERTNNSK